MSSKQDIIVIALGGNAILKPHEEGTAQDQMNNITETCRQLVQLLKRGHQLVLTHGNGPQVGAILLQNEAARNQVPPMPLDVCGAQSQGLIGYMFQQALRRELSRQGLSQSVSCVITQTEVDADDPAFENPTKPIGPFYSEEEAARLQQEFDFAMKEDAGRGYRRVVPSPDPRSIIERDAIAALLQQGGIVIASGGGGIPVTAEGKQLSGVEAVVDKDLAAHRLAEDAGADVLLILTDVERVMLNYGTDSEKPVSRMTVAQAKTYRDEGHFKEGSMEPKVRAGIRFVRSNPEGRAIIARLDQAVEAVDGTAGTEIIA